jgi:hypothetical protein
VTQRDRLRESHEQSDRKTDRQRNRTTKIHYRVRGRQRDTTIETQKVRERESVCDVQIN